VAQGVPCRLRPRIFLTFRHNKGGLSSAKRTGGLYPRRNPWYSLSEAESTSGHMVLSGVPRKKTPVTPPGIDLGTVRLVAQRLNRYATLGPHTSVLLTHKNKYKTSIGDHLLYSSNLLNRFLCYMNVYLHITSSAHNILVLNICKYFLYSFWYSPCTVIMEDISCNDIISPIC